MKNAIVTGASRGIGRAIAVMLAEQGYNLRLVCRNNTELLNELAKELTDKYGVVIKTYSGNIGNASFARSIFEGLDSLDVLVNNAGISYVGLVTDMEDAQWQEIVDVNLSSVFYMSREAVKLMLREHRGHIINISSVWGAVGASTEVAYSATKGGVNAFTKALAKEVAPSGIQVNAIACGLIDTDMNGHLSKEETEELVAGIPADRIGTPDDIAAALKALLGTGGYLTGQIITVDGGWI